MAETLRGGLSLGLGGFGFWSHDISGFESTATADLFKRWCAFGLLSSHSRLHGNQSYRVPWNFDEEAGEVLRFFTELKNTLMPYLWALAVESHTEGLPLMRAMFLEFPADPGCAGLDRQYMLGDSLLAAPVFSPGGDLSYYVPAGTWTSIISGERIESAGVWRREHHGYFSLPLLARPNTVIPLGDDKTRPDYDYAAGICFQVFELADGESRGAAVYDSSGVRACTFTISRRGQTYTARREGAAKPWKLLLRGVHAATVLVEGGAGDTRDSPEGLVYVHP
jgi:alpha-D-xyloside xylohydrolase